MKKTTKLIAGLAIALSSTMAMADGKTTYSTMCASCHGADANSPVVPTYPKLAGQNSGYVVEALKSYKDGTRSSAQAAIMKGMAMGLSETSMKEIGDYLESL